MSYIVSVRTYLNRHFHFMVLGSTAVIMIVHSIGSFLCGSQSFSNPNSSANSPEVVLNENSMDMKPEPVTVTPPKAKEAWSYDNAIASSEVGTPEKNVKVKLLLANVGDCRAVLCDGGVSTILCCVLLLLL